MSAFLRGVLSGCVVIFGAMLVLMFGGTGCGRGNRPQVTYDCGQTVIVDAQMGVIKKHQAVYLCEGKTLEWQAQGGETFTVEFDPKNCPFESCPIINNAAPKSPSGKHFDYLTVFKYTITVNGKAYDPHVVGGGGHG
jgi:hypothetical protein